MSRWERCLGDEFVMKLREFSVKGKWGKANDLLDFLRARNCFTFRELVGRIQHASIDYVVCDTHDAKLTKLELQYICQVNIECNNHV